MYEPRIGLVYRACMWALEALVLFEHLLQRPKDLLFSSYVATHVSNKWVHINRSQSIIIMCNDGSFSKINFQTGS